MSLLLAVCGLTVDASSCSLSTQCLESKDNQGVTWSFVIKKCFPGDNAKKMRECYDTRSDDLLRKVYLSCCRRSCV